MENKYQGIFKVSACRCRRCGGLLTSEQGLRDGIGHACKQKENRKKQIPGQIGFFAPELDESGGTDDGWDDKD